MNARELIEALQKLPPQAPVKLVTDTSDGNGEGVTMCDVTLCYVTKECVEGQDELVDTVNLE